MDVTLQDQPQASYGMRYKEMGSQTALAMFLTHLLKYLEDTRFLHTWHKAWGGEALL